jgi:hypothetical protein
MKRASVLLIGALFASACVSASGYEPGRYTARVDTTPDPDTAPLPPEPKTTIPDPKSPPAPRASASAAAAPAPAQAAASAKPAAPPPKPAAPAAAAAPAATAAADGECGSKENPCPMQKLMRGQISGAQTGPALEAAFNRLAGLSPNPGWAWASISKKGAELAKDGDVAGAKAQCKACHDQHRDAYKKQFRARKI